MTRAYEQKILNWLCTMALHLLVSALALLLAWRQTLIWAGIDGGEFGIDKYAGPMAEALEPHIAFFFPLAFWHLCDAFERNAQLPRWGGFLSRYRTFFVLLVLSSPFAIIGVVDGYILEPCDFPPYDPEDGPVFRFGHCEPETVSEIIFTLVIIPIMTFACISKAITTALSRFAIPPEVKEISLVGASAQ